MFLSLAYSAPALPLVLAVTAEEQAVAGVVALVGVLVVAAVQSEGAPQAVAVMAQGLYIAALCVPVDQRSCAAPGVAEPLAVLSLV